MKILRELNEQERNDLVERHVIDCEHEKCIHDSHIKGVVLGQPYCYKVNIFTDDYKGILVHSCIFNKYETLLFAVEYIKAHPDFLLKKRSKGVLNGDAVNQYKMKLEQRKGAFQERFTSFTNCFMHDGKTTKPEITDGMHRLVAYGLATDLNPEHFPIPAYYGTAERIS
ncbi:hypothetical protein ACFLYO_06965 [Chloroflexota bacterium]